MSKFLLKHILFSLHLKYTYEFAYFFLNDHWPLLLQSIIFIFIKSTNIFWEIEFSLKKLYWTHYIESHELLCAHNVCI